MIIICKNCGVHLTPDLKQLEEGSELNNTNGEELIPPGFYYLLHADDYFKERVEDIVINTTSALNLEDHSLPGRLNGCCGLDGADGLNKVCINGHEVATEKSDCWMPQYILFDPGKVITE